VLLQNSEDMLQEVELFVARARPEIVAMNDERLFLFVADFICDRGAALVSEPRIGMKKYLKIIFRNTFYCLGPHCGTLCLQACPA
jgi:hypothetical protein